MKQYHDGGEAIMEAFRTLGIDYVISSPGSEWSPVWEAVARQKVNQKAGPQYIDCWHETLAVDMAMGYTQVTEPLPGRAAARRRGPAARHRRHALGRPRRGADGHHVGRVR